MLGRRGLDAVLGRALLLFQIKKRKKRKTKNRDKKKRKEKTASSRERGGARGDEDATTRRRRGRGALGTTTTAATPTATPRTPRGDANAGGPSEGRGPWSVNHGAAKAAAAPGSGQRRAPGVPEHLKEGGEVEEYEWRWRWRWEAGGEKEPQL